MLLKSTARHQSFDDSAIMESSGRNFRHLQSKMRVETHKNANASSPDNTLIFDLEQFRMNYCSHFSLYKCTPRYGV
jgi:hypothetical protein